MKDVLKEELDSIINRRIKIISKKDFKGKKVNQKKIKNVVSEKFERVFDSIYDEIMEILS